MFKWIRYSGAGVTVALNPLHWYWVPKAGREFTDEWRGPNERAWSARFLFVTVRVWTDDGSW